MDLDAVVMAAGEGSRLRPLTERWPKPILPIDGRPVLGTLLRDLAGAGFASVTIVVGHLGDHVRTLVGDGSGFGLRVGYVDQPEPLGSADAVRQALKTGARAPLLVAAADTVFRPGAIAAAMQAWLVSGTTAGIAVRAVRAEELGQRSRVRVENGNIVELGTPGPAGHGQPSDRLSQARVSGRSEKCESPALAGHSGPTGLSDSLSLAAAPLWFLGEPVAARLDTLPGPPFELAEALRAAIAAAEPVAALEVGPTRDLTRPADVVSRNFPYLG
jgi:CTP:molybdopterin cytidylyltransferase MocA